MPTITTSKATVNYAVGSTTYLTLTDGNIGVASTVTVCVHPVGMWGSRPNEVVHYVAAMHDIPEAGRVTLKMEQIPLQNQPAACRPMVRKAMPAAGHLVMVIDIDSNPYDVDLDVQFEAV